MEKITNEENNWDQVANADIVEGLVEGISLAEIINAIKAMKTEKASGPSEEIVEMIVASGQVGEEVRRKLCQRMLDGKDKRDDWKISVKGDWKTMRVPTHREKS